MVPAVGRASLRSIWIVVVLFVLFGLMNLYIVARGISKVSLFIVVSLSYCLVNWDVMMAVMSVFLLVFVYDIAACWMGVGQYLDVSWEFGLWVW